MRIITIGDIHGGYSGLVEVLDKVEYCYDDMLVCIGDYVDGWPDSYEVVEHLLYLQNEKEKRGLPPNVYIRGNHDDYFEKFLREDESTLYKTHLDPHENYLFQIEYHEWLTNGGRTTLDSYRGRNPEDILRHKEGFFDKLVDYYEYPQGHSHRWASILWVHGGFDYRHGFDISKLSPQILYWDRSLYKRALHLWHLSQKEGYHVNESTMRFDDRKNIYIGHTCTLDDGFKTPPVLGNLINVDQGAGYHGKLTAYVYDTETEKHTFHQSRRLKKHYPKSKGRTWDY